MPFQAIDTDKLEDQVSSLLQLNDWCDVTDEELERVSHSAAAITSALSQEAQEMLMRFQARHHEHYARKHNLQKFLAGIVQFAVRGQSNNPVVELIAALDKKLVQ
jgi:hypothetical protein